MSEPQQDAVVAASSRMRCSYRGASDDFFCIRYQVWYPSADCAVRTKFKTSAGCLDCEQGRFNLKRHSTSLEGLRFHFLEEE